MRHVVALIIKFAIAFIVLISMFTIANNYPLANTIGLAFIVGIVSYIIGDLWILRATNNTISTIADMGLCTLLLWWIGPMVLNLPVPFLLALITAVIIGVGEWFFHKYMATSVNRNEEAYS